MNSNTGDESGKEHKEQQKKKKKSKRKTRKNVCPTTEWCWESGDRKNGKG